MNLMVPRNLLKLVPCLLFCLILINFSFAKTKQPEKLLKILPSVSLGGVTHQESTDAVCIYYYKKRPILINYWTPSTGGEGEEQAWINLNGKDVLLKHLPEPAINGFQYEQEGLLIKINNGPDTVPRKLKTEGYILKQARISISQGDHSITLPVKGGCGGGMDYGS